VFICSIWCIIVSIIVIHVVFAPTCVEVVQVLRGLRGGLVHPRGVVEGVHRGGQVEVP
jgi:hypothetical protein